MARLMILGGSNCQRNALAAAKRLGHETVLIDYCERPPAAALADIHVRASTFDPEACIRAAREYRVDGVFTIGTDQPVLTAALVAEACGLPGPIPSGTALAVTNKREMKRVLRAHGIPTAPYRLVSPENVRDGLSGLRPPLVLKPLDSQGQRGIFKLQSIGEARARLGDTLSFSREREALCEEFYPSDEITVSGWVENARLHILAATDRQLFEHPTHIGVCVGHRFPTVHMDRYPEIRALSEAVCAAFEIPNGPFYLQLLLGERGLVVNELACRIGGAFEDVFLPCLSGFDILGAVLSGALGQAADCSMLAGHDPSRCKKQVSVQLLFCQSGKIASATPLETLRALPGVLDAGYNFAPGDTVPALENATARFGHAVLACENGRMGELVAGFYQAFRVLDGAGRDLVIPRGYDGKIPETKDKGASI